jgi:hypothetical protein
MAADGVSIDVTNAGAFDAAMAAARTAAVEPKAALEAMAKAALVEASPPRRTGRLAGSGSATPEGPTRVRVTYSADYAAPIHWGWPRHDIERHAFAIAALRRDKPLAAATAGVQAALDKAAAKT